VENEVGRSERSRLDLIARTLKRNTEAEEIIDQIWRPISVARHQTLADDMTLLVIKLKTLMK
jgi:hypothetical protein